MKTETIKIAHRCISIEMTSDDIAFTFVEMWKKNPYQLKEAFNELKDNDCKAADAIKDIFIDRFKTEMAEFVKDQMDDDEIYESVVSYFDLEG